MPSIWSLETNDADAVALYHGIKDCPIATTPWTLQNNFTQTHHDFEMHME